MVLGSFWMLCGWGLGGLVFDRRKVQNYLAEEYPKDCWKGPRGRMSHHVGLLRVNRSGGFRRFWGGV